MSRTKWMRLQVRDLSDILRWAGSQDARRIDDFRYRVLHGRESVSFRLVPHYAIEVGTIDIVVICQVRVSAARAVAAHAARALRRLARAVDTQAARWRVMRPRQRFSAVAQAPVPVPAEAAPAGELRSLPWVQATSPSR